MAKKIIDYDFFGYRLHEALHVSEKEEHILGDIIQNIHREYESKIDKFTQNVIIAQIELLLTYSKRFYERQFITRKVTNHKILNRLEEILTGYFNSDYLERGVPTVQYIAENLNVSPII